MRRCCLSVLLLPALLSAQASTVAGSSLAVSGNLMQGALTISGQSFMAAPVTGAPFSAERVSERVHVASDGTRFTQTNRETIYRDSQGRIRTERPVLSGPYAPKDDPVVVEIQDPVAGFAYTLDRENQIAHRTVLQTQESRPAAGTGAGGSSRSIAAGASPSLVPANGGAVRAGVFTATVPPPSAPFAAPARPETKREDLGQQTLEGVLATGHRITHTFPAGSQGNDRPFHLVVESWVSPDLKENILSKTVDPRYGETTTRLIHINRAEPSADLFLPMPGYRVVDETGEFEIHWTAARQ